jgi:rubrerythrin
MAEFHLNHVAIVPREAVRKLFEAMLQADRDHIGALEHELARF